MVMITNNLFFCFSGLQQNVQAAVLKRFLLTCLKDSQPTYFYQLIQNKKVALKINQVFLIGCPQLNKQGLYHLVQQKDKENKLWSN